ncbi:hypothetical protein Cgig2_019553 [Carnegiea gigantea]|uniref:Uncharacterized protein n=1 Tax=Carnegiea gigantea TaxID=171969 RepID=A0A9Q1QK03_9CARY|nr:hypothetical protein Cgig2_019553 [Carnegiea gigantea]
MSTSTTQGDTYWASINDDIKAHLNWAIRVRDPVVVFEPMHHLTFAQPKSMAPALCVAACELIGGRRAHALPAASAIHVMQAAVHVHHNLLHKGRPKPMNHGFGPNIQLLTADGLLSFGYELMVKCNDNDNLGEEYSSRVLRATIEVARALGSQGMVAGQFREVECGCDEVALGEARGVEWLRYVHEKKDGGLHACGAACGAILGGGSEEDIEKLRKYGLYVGMIHGILNGAAGRKDEGVIEMVENLGELALKELKGFNATKIGAISTFIHLILAGLLGWDSNMKMSPTYGVDVWGRREDIEISGRAFLECCKAIMEDRRCRWGSIGRC